ncbi:hypothetical protein [Mycobacterium sp. MMS18-G62]
MWCKRFLCCVVAMAVFAGASISVGSATASAITGQQIFAAAKQIVPALARRLGLAEGRVESLFVSQATKLTPVSDEVALTRFQSEWAGFEPRVPAATELVERPPSLPGFYKHAAKIVCGTAAQLVDPFSDSDDESVWVTAIGQARDHIEQEYPVGKALAIYKDLNTIGEGFLNGCYCAAFAKLALFVATTKYC